MGHLGKSIEFWTKALALHDTYGALGGEKKRPQLVQGLQAAKDRDSGKEARDAMAAQHKLAEADAQKAVADEEFKFNEDGSEESDDKEDES